MRKVVAAAALTYILIIAPTMAFMDLYHSDLGRLEVSYFWAGYTGAMWCVVAPRIYRWGAGK